MEEKKNAFLCFLELMKNQTIPPLAPILLPQTVHSQTTWPVGLLEKHGSPAPWFIDFSRTVSAVMSFLIAQLNYTGLLAWLKCVKKQVYWLDKKSYSGLWSLPVLAVRIKPKASSLPSWAPTHHSRISYFTSPSSSHRVLTQLGCDVFEILSKH